VWQDIVGQPEAVATLSDPNAMTHAWLITGPPGSGRSNAAYAFAASLLCDDNGCGTCPHCRQVVARTHPDLAYLATERVIISIDEVRALVQKAYFSPSVSTYRVIVIEDADRMAERTSNVLLKALEEPPERTVWILCAPSEADLLPTIRSRVRSVRLRVPSIDTVADLLNERHGIDHDVARQAARLAQSHIGMAQRLALSPEAAARRAETVDLIVGVGGVHDAVMAAARLLDIATADANALTQERDTLELEQARASVGLGVADPVPPNMRTFFKTLEEQQKRRATRSLRDGIDRILVDVMSVYRDVLIQQLVESSHDDGDALINLEHADGVRALAVRRSPEQALAAIAAIEQARERIASNVAPVLALEAMLIQASRQ
jgi:DNA polymerase-3 subunit delta'